MKVAVISGEMQSGKSSLILLLASIYSRTQNKTVTVFSTGNMKSMLDLAEIRVPKDDTMSISVFKAMMQSHSLESKELLDYGTKVGLESVYAFDLWTPSVTDWDIQDLILSTMNCAPSNLALVEINGDLNSPLNKAILNDVDACLYVFNPTQVSVNNLKDYVENFDSKIVKKTGIVCQKYDPNVISESKLASMLRTKTRNFLAVHYNAVIAKEGLNGTITKCANYIADGKSETVVNRMKFLEIMQFLFDDSRHKIILGPDKWNK